MASTQSTLKGIITLIANTHSGRRRGRRHHYEHGPHRLRGLFNHGHGGRSVRRGGVRYAILAALRDQPMHGYQIITELETRTQSRWRPSAGSIYPTLQLLEDEGLLTSEIVEGRRTYRMTDAGREAAATLPDGWLDAEAGSQAGNLRKPAMGLVRAAMEVERVGSPEAKQTAQAILAESRKRLYALLAEDDTTAEQA